MTPQALAMQGVRKAFVGRTVLHGVDWAVPAGSLCGLIGANGAGKSTLLRLALGLLWPEEGRVEVLGQTLGRENARMRETVHYVASDGSPGPRFRVGEWLRYASLAYPRWDAERARRLTAALELAPDDRIGELSTGQRTSLQIAVAMAAHPDLLLLDEPTNGLDPVVKTRVLELLVEIAAAEGTTIVMATHHIEDVERLADRLAVLYDGRLVLEGELDAIKASMHRLEVVFPKGWPPELAQDPRIVHTERRGKAALITVEGPVEPWIAQCRNLGAVWVEPLDLDLTEVFRTVLEKEGYTRAEFRLGEGQ